MFFNLIKKRATFFFLIAILLVGLFLRGYHFSEWLHFELDQSRDAKIISWAAKEGALALPLLGPRAGGTFLRLGPAFYYLEYLGAKIFGNTPQGMASGILFFSALSLPLFYFFVRRYFDKKISLWLLALFSTSLFLVMYSRFAWNPNPLPFFVVLLSYSLLKAADVEEKRRAAWLLVSAGALAVTTQLHFLAFIVLPLVAFVFLVVKRPKLKIPAWIGAFLIIVVFYLPVIINDIKTGGENAKEFIEAVSGKSDKSKNNIVEKIIRNWSENSLAYFLIAGSRDNAELPNVKIAKPNPLSFDVSCDAFCRKNLPLGAVSLFLFTFGLLLLILNIAREKEKRRKDFLILNFLLFGVSFGVFTPIAFDISPRFFLLVAPLPFVLLGLLAERMEKMANRKAWIVTLIFLAFFISNLWAVKKRFAELENAQVKAVKIETDKILKEKARVTLKQQEMIVDYMESFHKTNGFPVYLNSEPYYRRAFLYHLEQRGIPQEDLRNSKIYQNGNYFLIYRTSSNWEKELEKYREAYDVAKTKPFGTLTVFHLVPKKEYITGIQQTIKPKEKPTSGPNVPKRFSWDELFVDEEEE